MMICIHWKSYLKMQDFGTNIRVVKHTMEVHTDHKPLFLCTTKSAFGGGLLRPAEETYAKCTLHRRCSCPCFVALAIHIYSFSWLWRKANGSRRVVQAKCVTSLFFQSKTRRKPTFREAQRRAQSEGPGIRNPLFRVAPDEPDIRPTVPGSARSTSARGRSSHGSRKAHASSSDMTSSQQQVIILELFLCTFSAIPAVAEIYRHAGH